MMKTADADAGQLQKHMSGTYHSLRMGMGVIAVGLPLFLWVIGGLLADEPLRCSMSAYYHSPVMRDWFVGALVAVGVLLYLYKGFSTAENVILNIAGICAVGIATIPTGTDCSGPIAASLHGALAVLFFACIAYVSVFRASDTLSLIRDVKVAERYRNAYRVLGGAMLVSPLVAVTLTLILQTRSSMIFFIEAVGVWAFAAYWITKSVEMKATEAERLALERKLKPAATPSPSKTNPGRVVQVAPDDADMPAV